MSEYDHGWLAGLENGCERAAADIRALAADRDRVRPLRKDAQTPTDFADDFEWAAMIAEQSVLRHA